MMKVVIVGTGGLARELTSWIADQWEVAGYSALDPEEHHRFELPGAFFGKQIVPTEAGTTHALLAIGSPEARQRAHEELEASGFDLPVFVHRSAVVSPAAVLERGVVVAPCCVVAPGVRLRESCFVNFCCGIGHDADIGRFCQINPGAQIGGEVVIGAGTLVGSGATILQGLSIGSGATVGSGAAVFGRVRDGATVMGNPARRLRAFE